MRDDLARQTYDTLLHGLKLRDRIAAGDRPHLGTEQAKLKSMLGTSQAPAPWGGGADPTRTVDSGSNPDFLGIRYALTCWLRSEEHTSELQSHSDLVCRLLLEKKN